jgi:NADH-quinone oxidoreductase subunit N
LYLGLAVFAVMMSLVGAFYYLRLIKVMYFDEAVSQAPIVAALDVRFVLCLNGALVLLLGLMPGGLMSLCARSILQMLGT